MYEYRNLFLGFKLHQCQKILFLDDIPRHKIIEIYKQECEETFSRELGTSNLTIAYSHPSNIQSIIAKAKLFEVEGNEVSKHFTGEPN
jgi:hypothetical protein